MEESKQTQEIEIAIQFLKVYSSYLSEKVALFFHTVEEDQLKRLKVFSDTMRQLTPESGIDLVRSKSHEVFNSNFTFQSFNPEQHILDFWAENTQQNQNIQKKLIVDFDASTYANNTRFAPLISGFYAAQKRLMRLFYKEKKEQELHRLIPIRNMISILVIYPVFSRLLDQLNTEFAKQFDEVQSICNYVDKAFPKRVTNDEDAEKPDVPIHWEESHSGLLQLIQDIITKRETQAVQRDELLLGLEEELMEALRTVGTVQHSAAQYSDAKVKSKAEKQISKLDRSLKHWEKSYNSFYRYWVFQDQLIEQREALNHAFNHFVEDSSRMIKTDLIPLNDSVITFFESEIEQFNNLSPDYTFADNNETNTRIKKEFTHDLLPTLVGAIGKISDRKLFLGLQENVSDIIKRFPDRVVLKRGEENGETEFTEFVPQELITYELAPVFSSLLEELKDSVQSTIQELQTSILNIDRMIDFSFAVVAEDHRQDEVLNEKQKAILLDSFDRARTQLKKVNEKFLEHETNVNQRTEEIQERFDKRLESLSQSDKIFQLRLQVSRSKATQKSLSVKNKVKDWGLSILPAIQKRSKDLLESSSSKINPLLMKYKFMKNENTMDLELATFLYETELALEALPFVYKRLFSLEPVSRMEYFIGREKEIELLDKVYDRWKEDVPTSVVLLGEKGAGVSSLVNYFLESNELSLKAILLKMEQSVDKLDLLIHSLSEALNLGEVEDVKTLIEKIQGLESRHIVVLDGLDCFFLRQMKGFHALDQLFALISQTQDKLFWVVECHRFSWDFLKSTHRICDAFSLVVPLEPLDTENLRTIICSRHEVSQYQIKWLDSSVKQEEITEEVQKKRASAYYQALQKVAKTNVSIALYYWLRSIRKIENHTLYIHPIENLNNVWLHNLPRTTLFMLHGILIHSRIGLDQLATTLGMDIEICKQEVVLLQKNGIVLKKENYLQVNPLLYTSIAEYLATQNIIH